MSPRDGGAYDDDEEPSVVWSPDQYLPADARRMGLSSSVPDGALLSFAGALDPAKPRHRLVAWVMLGVLGAPVLLQVAGFLRSLGG